MKCDKCGKEADCKVCTCTAYLCSEECEKQHTGGLSIEQMKELEGEESLV